MTTSDGFNERRAFGRKPTNQHALVLAPGRAPVRCTVRDLSAGGASLEFGRPVSVPARFALKWDGSGVTANCEVRHSWATGVGVQFATSIESEIGDKKHDPAAQLSRPASARHAQDGEPAQHSGDENASLAAVSAATPPPLPAWFVANAKPASVADLIRAKRSLRFGPLTQPAGT
jgi:hypothetical protein